VWTMLTRAKSRLEQVQRVAETPQHPIIEAIHLLSAGDAELSIQSVDISTHLSQSKTRLGIAIDRHDFSRICELLSASRLSTLPALQSSTENFQDVLDHCLYGLFSRPRKSRRADGQPYAYYWAHNKDVDITAEKCTEIMELLLAAGANPRTTDSNGLTFLHWLAQRHDEGDKLNQIARLFFDTGCDVEARDGIYGATPLGWSAWFG
jgi:hypothetical protein